mmetsp:Transcript_6543/g.13417  ORF Transcript_6543/g.13417 Transcript_6543/m.13417 type:complete len:224 (-) Transcript_6543:93-764(-)
MPHPHLSGRRRDLAGKADDGGVIMHPLVQDDLSRISEASWEGGSVASTYFSAVSNTASATLHAKDRRLLTAAGASQAAGADAELLRRTVKAFVELSVRGHRLEALRHDRQAHPVVFRLSRHVDAFEIEREGGNASQRVHLSEVAAVRAGEEAAAAQRELAAALALDGRCALVDFRDGRCLALRFPPGPGEEPGSAKAFVRCMQIFVQEVQRERAKPPVAASLK